MTEFYFEEIAPMADRPDEVYTKEIEGRTEYTTDRATPFSEEWQALKNNYEVLPDHFPQPVNAVWNENDELLQYSMEELDFDARIEYAFDDGMDPATVENAYAALEEVVSVMHEHPELAPHGDLIGNTFIVDDTPVLIDPRGVPESQEEEQEWMQEDIWQLNWLRDNGLPETVFQSP